MAVGVRFVTDPACSWSWSAEPVVRRLMADFGDELAWTWVMGGLARDYTRGYSDSEVGIGGPEGAYPGLVAHWLDVADRGGMPIDPRLWIEGPISSTYPACMAVKAAAEQSRDGGYAYLRALREGLMCMRRKLDTTEALVDAARPVGLDVARFRIDLGSHAIVEAFGRDLDLTWDVPESARAAGQVEQGDGHERVPLPSAIFVSEDGSRHELFGPASYEEHRAAAEAAGALPSGDPAPGVLDALRRFGRMATREVEVVCGLPGPVAAAELWSLAREWRVRPVPVLTGHLWEPA